MHTRSIVAFLGIVAAFGCGGKVTLVSEDAGVDGSVGTGGTAGTAGGGGMGGKGGTGGFNPMDGGGNNGGYAGKGGSGGTHMDGGGNNGGYAGGAGVGGPGGTVPPPPAQLGTKCSSDPECGNALVCAGAGSNSFYTGGPANGYCTLECFANPSVCESLGGLCTDLSAPGQPPHFYCLQDCVPGPPLQQFDGKFDPNKCHGRKDVACMTLYDAGGNPTANECWPTCTSDSQCAASGRICDPLYKICVDKALAHTGAPFGAHCDPMADAGPETCAGLCIQVLKSDDAGPTDPNNIASYCTETCVFGDLSSCGFKDAPPAGMCILSNMDSGNGDEAWCAQLCDVDADCLDSQDHALCDTSYVQYLGRGLCWFGY